MTLLCVRQADRCRRTYHLGCGPRAPADPYMILRNLRWLPLQRSLQRLWDMLPSVPAQSHNRTRTRMEVAETAPFFWTYRTPGLET